MPQLQWLGRIPERRSTGSKVAEVLGAGFKGFERGKERRVKEAAAESVMDLKQKEYDLQWSKHDYDKRKDIYDTIVKMLPNLPEDKQVAATTSPEFLSLEKGLGVPSISGTTLKPESELTWAQEQNVASVRADLVRGRGSIKDFYGKPEPTEIKTMDEALDYISNKHLNPADFKAELQQFTNAAPSVADKGGARDQYKVGQTIEKDGTTYTYQGNGKWGY